MGVVVCCMVLLERLWLSQLSVVLHCAALLA